MRLTRAALFAFGTGALALAPNCSSTPDQLETFDGGGLSPGYGGVGVPADSGLADTGPHTLLDAAYGAFALDAADAAGDAEGAEDGGDAEPVLLDAAYGAFPIDSGHD